jgi:septum formation protein
LLKGLGVDFELALPYEVDETFPIDLPRTEVPAYLAKLKSEKYPKALQDNEILITADTLVWCKYQFLGKPKNEADARRMLKLMSGSMHEVLTGVCLRSTKKTTVFTATTMVYFRSLTNEEIDFYLTNYKPFDKAGAYGIQEWIGFAAIKRIEGSYYNVMGLPTQLLYLQLQKFLVN